ncbi:hypothetical protein TMatcc_007220 [Talaromyces marneffei ATCC 18224]
MADLLTLLASAACEISSVRSSSRLTKATTTPSSSSSVRLSDVSSEAIAATILFVLSEGLLEINTVMRVPVVEAGTCEFRQIAKLSVSTNFMKPSMLNSLTSEITKAPFFRNGLMPQSGTLLMTMIS